MENIPVVALEDFANGIPAFEEPYGQLTASEMLGVPGHAIILSYAPPDMVRQAKLEALEVKVRRKVFEQKASVLDTYALSELSVSEVSPVAVRVSSRDTGMGSLQLVKSLVVPPVLTERGEEVCGSSEFVVDGERLEYQRPGRIRHSVVQAARPMPYYRTYDPFTGMSMSGSEKQQTWGGGESATADTGPRKKGAVAAASGGGGGSTSGGGGGGGDGLYGASTARKGVGGWGDRVGGRARTSATRQELKAQLSDGMLTYVPSKFARPTHVGSTAFVPQGQAMEQARHKYQSAKQRRPSSAPLRRNGAAAQKGPNQAATGGGGDGGGIAGNVPGGGGGAAAAEAAAAAATAAAGDGLLAVDGGSDALCNRSGATRERKWMGLSVVCVEETDLLAMYRQISQQQQQQQQEQQQLQEQQQQQQQGPAMPRSASGKLRAASARSFASLATAAAAAPRPGPNDGRGNGSGGGAPARTGASITTSTPGGPVTQGEEAAAKARQRPASALAAAAVKTAWADSKRAAQASNTAKRPVTPATAMEAAAVAAAKAGRPLAAQRGFAGPWEGPRPPPPSRTPASSRPASQRRLSAPAETAACPGAVAAASDDNGATGSAARGVLHPVDPELRRQRQNRPGSAISTAKTNRVRGPQRSSGSLSYGVPPTAAAAAAAPDAGSAQQRAWTNSSATRPLQCDRTLLQERILDGLIRQYTLGPDDVDADGPSAMAEPDGNPMPAQQRPARSKRSTSDASASGSFGFANGGGGGGGLLAAQRSAAGQGADQRQPYQPPPPPAAASHYGSRPQSAPNRRVRPPSPGHWAGRPDPDALLARASMLQHSATGILYDPELQPSPLDIRMNRLEGLD